MEPQRRAQRLPEVVRELEKAEVSSAQWLLLSAGGREVAE